jgi:anthranilate phosphoribosyltransferase
MIKHCINKLLQHLELTATELQAALGEVLSGDNPEQIAAFLLLLRQKGETVSEIEIMVRYLQQKMRVVQLDKPVLDIVGTGGDGFNTINISTAAAILAASCGVNVLKHGGRAGSSLTGSADLMEAFGYNLQLDNNAINALLNKYRFAFCAAPNFHQSFAKTKAIRKKLAIPTVFNLLGPLLNPARAEYIMLGVAEQKYLPLMAQVLQNLGIRKGLVFNCQGIDEICSVGIIDVFEVTHEEIKQYQLDPAAFGFVKCEIANLRGGDACCNKEIITAVLRGERQDACSDAIIFNAGVANYIYGVSADISTGIALARRQQKNGAAYKLLQKIISLSNNVEDSDHA